MQLIYAWSLEVSSAAPPFEYHHKYMRPRDYGNKLRARRGKPKPKTKRTELAEAPRKAAPTREAPRKSSSEAARKPATTRVLASTSAKRTLDRILSKAGLGSRTDAEAWIKEGRVKVNGRAAKSIEMWIDPKRDKITLDGAPILEGPKLYILLYKPKGYITTYKDPEGRPTVYQLLKGVPGFVGTAGRLDMDTSGLLILTNDTAFAEFVTNPASHVPKTYLVKSSTRLTDEQLDLLRAGPMLDDGPTRPAIVTRLRDSEKYTHFEITISEGRNRQVRRMVEAIGSKVLKLVRVKIGGLSIDGLQIGSWRRLTNNEVKQLIGAPQ
ncbi:MAG TPA: pseudouridine synthase [Bryobacteraceae bacterium]|nr:pseudouridine synthase [Bryobacteraceae bacterium]